MLLHNYAQAAAWALCKIASFAHTHTHARTLPRNMHGPSLFCSKPLRVDQTETSRNRLQLPVAADYSQAAPTIQVPPASPLTAMTQIPAVSWSRLCRRSPFPSSLHPSIDPLPRADVATVRSPRSCRKEILDEGDPARHALHTHGKTRHSEFLLTGQSAMERSPFGPTCYA